MRKALANIGLVLVLVASLAACGDLEPPPPPPTTTTTTESGETSSHPAGGARLSGRGSVVTASTPSVVSPPPPVSPSPLPPGAKRVRVVDMQGRPVVGARVRRLRGGPQDGHVTDEDGRAPTGRLGGGHGTPSQFRRSSTVVIEADGYAPHPYYCRAHDKGEEVITLRTRGHRLAGLCRSASGEAIPHARLALREGEVTLRFEADSTGRFITTRAWPNRGTLEARVDGWIAPSVDVVPPSDLVDIVLYRPTRIRGQLDVEPARRRSALRRLRLEPQAHAVEVDEETMRFEVTAFPGEVSLWTGRAPIGRYVLLEGEILELGVIQPEPVAPVPSARESAAERPFVELEFGDTVNRELHVVGCFQKDGVVDLGYASPDAPRVEFSASDLLWLGFTWTGGAACWRQAARVGDRLPIVVPGLSRVRVDSLRSAQEYVTKGGVALRWAGSVVHAASLRPPTLPEEIVGTTRGVGAGVYDLVWHPSFHAETVLLRRDIVIAPGGADVDLGDVDVPGPVRLEVAVEDAAGRAVPVAVVTLGRGREKRALRTDALGRALFEVRDPTAITLVAEAPGFGRATRYLATADLDRVVVLRLGE